MGNKRFDKSLKPINYHILTITGSIAPALIIIFGVFLAVIYGLLLVLTLQLDYSHRQLASEEALSVAEAGINYYRWHLAHDPTDYQDGTGNTGPYIHEYNDPGGGRIGQYTLNIIPPEDGSNIVTVESTAETDRFPGIQRTITARFGSPSISEYAFLNNGSTWYGSNITVTGPIHSNNGIRMDGTNLSYVRSAKEDYQCGSETGCLPPQNRPGVWGAGGDQSLWEFPVPAVDFDSISVDLSEMRTAAQTGGLHLDETSNQDDGYHIVFNGTTFSVYLVEDTERVRGYSVPGQGLGNQGLGGCRWLDQLIDDESLLGTYNISDNPIIFVEDNLWVEGTVDGRVTVAAATFPLQSSSVDVWIIDNLVYAAYNGSDNIGLVAEGDIYLARDVPNQFNIDGALISQQGKIIRHGYYTGCGGGSWSIKQKLTINGSLTSYFKSYWNFGNPLVSGFVEREINYDSNLLYAPPPYFPTTGEYELISWEEN